MHCNISDLLLTVWNRKLPIILSFRLQFYLATLFFLTQIRLIKFIKHGHGQKCNHFHAIHYIIIEIEIETKLPKHWDTVQNNVRTVYILQTLKFKWRENTFLWISHVLHNFRRCSFRISLIVWENYDECKM